MNIQLSILISLSWLIFTAHAGPLESTKKINKIKIVFLGDSLTEGYGIDKSAAYPALVQTILTNESYNIEIINAGVSGSTSASAPSRIKWFLKNKPDIIFLALGANDGLRGIKLKTTKANLKETIIQAKKNKIQLWLAGMKIPPNYGKSYTDEFIKMFHEIAQEEKIPLLPFLLQDVAGNTKLNQPDGIHPNEAGHKIIAIHVAKFIKDNL